MTVLLQVFLCENINKVCQLITKLFQFSNSGFETNTVPRSRGHQKLARDFLTLKSEVLLGLLNFKRNVIIMNFIVRLHIFCQYTF